MNLGPFDSQEEEEAFLDLLSGHFYNIMEDAGHPPTPYIAIAFGRAWRLALDGVPDERANEPETEEE